MIYDRLLPNEAFARQTESHLEYFAVDGLRTLCIAEATIDEQSYQVGGCSEHVAMMSCGDDVMWR